MSQEVLLVGLPRSGTSWVGGVLGASASITYHREPITQAWLNAGHKTPLVDPEADPGYEAFVASVLRPNRERRLVKEVNPLLVPWVLSNTSIQVLLLRRHPCAVALSYHERGWTGLDVAKRFGVESAGDFWEDHGTYQAMLLASAVSTIEGKGVVASYEALTENPEEEFAALAGALEIGWGTASSAYLADTLSRDDRGDPYALQRNATAARDRWLTALTDRQKAAVLAGYVRHGGEDPSKSDDTGRPG